MKRAFDPRKNYARTKKLVGWKPRRQTSAETYNELGFICGLEVHQQLNTEKKLFCNCPAGKYQKHEEYNAEIIRHMRPTLSELGEYDGTALMEFRTRKTIIYRIRNETTCTYEIDDTPPFPINRQALEIAIEIALLLKTNVVGELHITRKQYLDGSIPTGFQRTAIVGIEGLIPLKKKNVRIIQLSVEEDSCREISDQGHFRIYSTDRLGMPLVETVTYPDMLTPEEAAEAAHYIRFLTRSSGQVRQGIGAAREDVNVSIRGGTRVEIKGVARIAWIPELVHNEAFRQKALLLIRDEIQKRGIRTEEWKIKWEEIDPRSINGNFALLKEIRRKKLKLIAVNLPDFSGLLSFFTQPAKMFADELSDRLKVIACLEKPNLLHSEQFELPDNQQIFPRLTKVLDASEKDAQLLFWTPEEDLSTALETIEERCRLAFKGVPNETRKALADGTTIFERVLPGPDRMYPDTDSAPVPIAEALIELIRSGLPRPVRDWIVQFERWGIPEDTHSFLLKYNLAILLERISSQLGFAPRFVATLIAHNLKNLFGRYPDLNNFNFERIFDLFQFIASEQLQPEIARRILPELYRHPKMDFHSILTTIGFQRCNREVILELIPILRKKFSRICTSKDPQAAWRWICGNLRLRALGNLPMAEIARLVESGEQK